MSRFTSSIVHICLSLFTIMAATGFAFLSPLLDVITNGDFESGTLNGWNTAGQISISTTGLDPTTDNVMERVAQGQYSAQIGDETPWMGGTDQQSSMDQVIQLPQNLPSGSVLEFVYAVVANDPPDHPESDKPRFRILVNDTTSDQLLLDTEYLYTSQTSKDWYLGTGASNQVWNQPYYMLAGDRWVFRPWKLVSIPLSGLNGHELTIRFEVRDCNYGAHAIYGLLDNVRVGSPSNDKLPALQGNPQQAVYIAPPIWAPILHWFETWGIIWACCLIPLLILGSLLFMLLRRRTRPRMESTFYPIPSEKEPESKITGGIRKKLDDE